MEKEKNFSLEQLEIIKLLAGEKLNTIKAKKLNYENDKKMSEKKMRDALAKCFNEKLEFQEIADRASLLIAEKIKEINENE